MENVDLKNVKYQSWGDGDGWTDAEIEFIKSKDCHCDMCYESVLGMDDFPRINIEKNELMCEDCEKEYHYTICDCCEDLQPNEMIRTYFFMSKETAEQYDLKCGIYKILKRPFYFSDGFSIIMFFDDAFELVKEIDINKENDCDIKAEIICDSCAERFIEPQKSPE